MSRANGILLDEQALSARSPRYGEDRRNVGIRRARSGAHHKRVDEEPDQLELDTIGGLLKQGADAKVLLLRVAMQYNLER